LSRNGLRGDPKPRVSRINVSQPNRMETDVGLENPLHLMIILMVVLLVFGAKRLPEMGRSLGSGMRGFKEAISGELTTNEPAVTDHPAVTAITQTETDSDRVTPSI
jgi:sec-independent protein translocase protein TatA